MKRIAMTRPKIVEGKMYGRGGVYVVADRVAKFLRESDACRILGNLGDDAPESSEIKDPEFLRKIRLHAVEIAQIMEEELRNTYEPQFEDLSKKIDDSSTESSEGIETETQNAAEGDGSDESNESNSNVDQEVTAEPEFKSDIPDSFPCRKQLIDAGFDTIEKLKATKYEDLVKIEGIGDRRAGQIGLMLTEL